MISRFGDIPVGYYTGTADISIPIYTIKEGGVQIPVMLSYHSSGVKVEDQATWVGLGWNLEPEGTIIQIVQGKEDTLDVTTSSSGYSYLKGRAVAGSYTASNEVGNKTWSCEVGAMGGAHCGLTTDSVGDEIGIINDLLAGGNQPDIYQYSFAGHSGKFFINPDTHEIVQIDKKDQITFEKGGAAQWIATTLDGNKFYFDALETSHGSGTFENTGYTWKLTQIILTNHKTIDFSYADAHYFWYIFREEWHSDYPLNLSSGTNYSAGDAATQHNMKILKRITTSDVVILFNLEDRLDMNLNTSDSAKKLRSIDITSAVSHKKLKTFDFQYSYFPYSTVGGNFNESASLLTTAEEDKLGKRLRLDTLHELAYSENGDTLFNNGRYVFTYDMSTTLPLKTSSARDFWGYYNGKDNASLLPDLSYFYYSGVRPDPNPPPVPDVTAVPDPINLSYTSANRVPDNSKVTAGILKKIQYPTGGYTEFDYEPNSFPNYRLPDQAKIDSTYKHFIVHDQNLTGDSTAKHFTLQKTTIVRFTNSIGNGYPVQTPSPLSYSDMSGSSITLKKVTFPGGAGTTPTFTTLKTWDLSSVLSSDFSNNHGVTWTEDVTVNYDADPNCYFLVSTSLPDALGAQGSSTKVAYIQSDFNYYDQNGIDMTSRQCGVRVAAIRNYTDSGVIASKTILRYINEDSTSSGKLMAPLTLLNTRYLWFETLPSDATACSGLIGTSAWAWFVSSDSYTSSSGNPVGYSRVEEINVAPDGSTNGKRVFNYINQESQTIINVPDIPYLKNGLLSKDETFDSSGTKLLENNYSYEDIEDSTRPYFSGVKIFSNWIGLDQCESGFVGTMDSMPGHKYLIYYYPINTEWNLAHTIETKQYDGSNVLSNLETYSYNSLGQLVSMTTENSKQQTVTKTTLYPIDDTSGSTETALLVYNKQYDRPIDQRTLINGTEVNKIHYGYWYKFSGAAQIITPTSIQTSNKQQPLYTNVTFDDYDSSRNILQFSQNGMSNAIIWSDNRSYAIASIINASSGKAAYTSFEPNEKGNWSGINLSYILTGGVTGKKYYDRSSFSISHSGLSSGDSYILSYWSKGSSYTVSGTQSGYPKLLNTIVKDSETWTLYEHLVTGQTTITVSGSGGIDELRLFPQPGQMTTYVYDPVVGIISQCDRNSRINTFQYDNFNRLRLVRDQDNNILKQICYNYAGQVEDCGIAAVCTSCTGNDKKCINGVCETGTKVYLSSTLLRNGTWSCSYEYIWSDCSVSDRFTETSLISPCEIGSECQ